MLKSNLSKNLLLLSSSRVNNSGYLEPCLPLIKQFLLDATKSLLSHSNNIQSPIKKLLFIPYAGISIGFDQYETMVASALKTIDIDIISIHKLKHKAESIGKCQGILIGGGNTFSLLEMLYQKDLLQAIRQTVNSGTPYIGWSAGSNIAAPSIKTTNDMPIVEPQSFDALNILPWQINPHYIEGNPTGHNGETRQQRIEEFLLANPSKKVLAIAEGTAIKLQKEHLSYIGESSGYLFSDNSKVSFNSKTDLNGLLGLV